MSDDAASSAVLLVSADLFLGSRIQGAVAAKGAKLSVAAGGTAAMTRLAEQAFSLVLIDLETPGLDPVEVVTAASASVATPTVAYGPHVKEYMLSVAKVAGCTEVLSRGKFDATIGEILSRYLA